MAKIHQLKPGARATTLKSESYMLRLFTTGTSPRSTRALRNLHEICEDNLKGRYRLEVIDITRSRVAPANLTSLRRRL